MGPRPPLTCRPVCQVLDTLAYADQELLAARPHLRTAEVWVHFQSSVQVGRRGGGSWA